MGRLGALQPVGKQLQPVEGAGIEHPVLARAAAAIAAPSKPRTAKTWVGRLPRELKPLTGTVARPLVDRGILLGLLEPLELVDRLLEGHRRHQRREARKRAREIAAHGIAGSTVSDAVRDIQAAVLAGHGHHCFLRHDCLPGVRPRESGIDVDACGHVGRGDLRPRS